MARDADAGEVPATDRAAIELANNPTPNPIGVVIDDRDHQADALGALAIVDAGAHQVFAYGDLAVWHGGFGRRLPPASRFTTDVIELSLAPGEVAVLELDVSAWTDHASLHVAGTRTLTTDDLDSLGRMASGRPVVGMPGRARDEAAPAGPPLEGLPVPPDAPPGAGWHRDPTGRHEHRWYDGTTWSVFVTDGGTTDVDAT